MVTLMLKALEWLFFIIKNMDPNWFPLYILACQLYRRKSTSVNWNALTFAPLYQSILVLHISYTALNEMM